jgi:misacylated tRNA(Ala) deacylase
MTEPLYRDAYATAAPLRVAGVTEEGGIVPEASLFYPTGGGQPGDTGRIAWAGGEVAIVDTRKGADGRVILVPAPGGPLPEPGAEGMQTIDWERRYAHMKVHTALHLLSVVIPLPVTGGQISAEKGRLDFDMAEPPGDREQLAVALQGLVDRDLPVSETWITDDDLAARPELVKTMSVAPPAGQGRVRLVRIGEGEAQVDLQPCGGTHVARTGEIGPVGIGKIEKKGARNRRVNVLLGG